MAADYIRAIERNGGIPILIPNIKNMEDMSLVLDKVDGLLLSGGHDVNPRTYNERNSGKAGKFDNLRDHEEIFMTEYALEKDIPFLGICRGLQILNVTLGGSIHQDLPSAGFPAHSMSNSLRNEPSHELKVLEDTPLFDIFKREEIWTNSYHHQGINELGKGLKKSCSIRRRPSRSSLLRWQKICPCSTMAPRNDVRRQGNEYDFWKIYWRLQVSL